MVQSPGHAICSHANVNMSCTSTGSSSSSTTPAAALHPTLQQIAAHIVAIFLYVHHRIAICKVHQEWLGVVLCYSQIAVSLNYNKVYGWIDFDSISPEYISKNFDAEWKKQSAKYPMDLPNMKKLYDAVDVIGLSGVRRAADAAAAAPTAAAVGIS
jgi:hypothetical protein